MTRLLLAVLLCWATAAQAAPCVGVNLSGGEYSWEPLAPTRVLDDLQARGVTLIRLPIAWERLQPRLYQALDPAALASLRTTLASMAARHMQVVVDLHSYARYQSGWAAQVAAGKSVAPGGGDALGSAALPIGAFADFWWRFASALHGAPGLAGYDLANEPHDLPGGSSTWAQAAQAAITSIRSVDYDTSIMVEGYGWATASGWAAQNPTFPLTDPVHRLVYEAHQYFDDGSSNYAQTYAQQGATPALGAARVAPFIAWLRQFGVPGYVGEIGVPGNDPAWLPVLSGALAALQQAGVPATVWFVAYDEPAGSNPWWLDNAQDRTQLGLNPSAASVEAPQWSALRPMLGGSGCFR